MNKLFAKVWLLIVGFILVGVLGTLAIRAVYEEPYCAAFALVVWLLGYVTLESLLTLIRE